MTPDFARIARDTITRAKDDAEAVSLFESHLRLIWNARGAADIATMETAAAGAVWAGPLSRLLRDVDCGLRVMR